MPLLMKLPTESTYRKAAMAERWILGDNAIRLYAAVMGADLDSYRDGLPQTTIFETDGDVTE